MACGQSFNLNANCFSWEPQRLVTYPALSQLLGGYVALYKESPGALTLCEFMVFGEQDYSPSKNLFVFILL